MQRKTRKLGLETLETREVCAGNVNVFVDAAGVLQIAGDSLRNAVQVQDTGFNVYRVEGLDGTKINGSVSRTLAVPADKIKVNLGAGNDRFALVNSTIKALNIDTAQGSDFVGVVGTTITGSANITTGTDSQADSDLVALADAHVMGNLTVKLGGGHDTFSLVDSKVDAFLAVYGQSGIDSFNYKNNKVGAFWAWSSMETKLT